jgi:DNA polymerase-3 subunit delta'
MEDLLLHPAVRVSVEHFVHNPVHALLLIGPEGAGKTYLAKTLLQAILQHNLTNYPYYLHIAPQGASISIEEIRRVHEFARLKTIGTGTIRRAVLVEDAQALTTEAQNAFLKLLEEPPADTLFVLTATSKNALLPTIYSRTQHIVVRPPAQANSEAYFAKQGHKTTDITRAYYIADGHAGLMTNLLSKGNDHPLVAAINQAKQLLQATHFERLAQVDMLAKQKDTLPQLLWAIERVCHAALSAASQKDNKTEVKRWLANEKFLLEAQASLSANPQSKLLLTHLMLSL